MGSSSRKHGWNRGAGLHGIFVRIWTADAEPGRIKRSASSGDPRVPLTNRDPSGSGNAAQKPSRGGWPMSQSRETSGRVHAGSVAELFARYLEHQVNAQAEGLGFAPGTD